MTVDPIDLTQGSVRCASVTPAEGGAIELLTETLQNAGFAWHRADRGRIASYVAAAIHLSKSLLAGTAILDRMEVEGEAMSVYLVGGPTCPDEMDHLASQTLDEGSDHFDASTTCSTSGARFVKDHCPVVEFGQIGKTMHQVDERVEVAQIPVLASIYRRFLTEYFA